jgi:hypothetical protein
MKAALVLVISIFMLLATFPPYIGAQSHPKQDEQTDFQEDEAIQHPVSLPKPILDLLAKSDRVKDCLKYNKSLKEISASWFEAGAVTLGRNASNGFVVKGKESCLWAADASWYWIFRQTGGEYDMVLSNAGNALSLLNSYTGGYRDVEVFRASAAELSTTKYKFNGTVYEIAKNTSKPVPHNQPSERLNFALATEFLR